MYHATEHFRISGVYWGLTAMHLLGRLDRMDKVAILDWVMRCQKEDGGFGGSERHDSHMLYTLSAVQILALYDRLDLLDVEKVVKCVCASQILSPSHVASRVIFYQSFMFRPL
jgi:geranylgeranyl transferase type-2 subunit beta